jgi:hypothetical protein
MYSTQPTASHFIDGRYVEDISGARFDVIYPASGAVIAQIHAGTDHIIEQALSAAQAAQQDWAARSGTERGRVQLYAIWPAYRLTLCSLGQQVKPWCRWRLVKRAARRC